MENNKIKFVCKGCSGLCTKGKCNYCGNFNEEYNNLDRYENLYDNYNAIISGKQKLNDEDCRFFFESFLDRNFENNSEFSNMLIKLFSKEMVENGKLFSISEKEKIFLAFADMISREKNVNEKLNIVFLDHKNMKNCNGIYVAETNAIALSRKLLDTNPIEAYSTIFHELTHVQQNREINHDRIISVLRIYEIMDIINRKELGQKYYDDNYRNLPEEIEAYRYQYTSSIDFFKSLNVEIPKEIIEKADKCNEKLSNIINSNEFVYRKVEDKYYPINYLLAKNIKDKPEYLDKYPQLKIAFKVQNGHVIDKSSEDLKVDFFKYFYDNTILNGNEDEIYALYTNMIRNTRNIENQLAEMTVSEEEKNNSKVMGYSSLFIIIPLVTIICLGIVIFGTLLN